MSRLIAASRQAALFRPLSLSMRVQQVDTKKMIMSMRKETQLPLKNCREALVETDWDFEAAKVYLKKEAKRLGLKKMASLASRAVTEGLVGTHINGDKVAMIIVNCESEPVAKTDEFNQLLQILAQLISNQEPGNYAEEAVLKMDGVHDAMVDAIGLLRENIRIKKAQIVQGKNIGLYVRSSNQTYPSNGSYAAIASLTGGDDELASNLAKHCVLELPDKTGKKPKIPVDDEAVKNDEYRLYYQSLNGGVETVWNALERRDAQLVSWARFHVSG